MPKRFTPERLEKLIGKKWGRWKLLRSVGLLNGKTAGVFECDCGTTKTYRLSVVTTQTGTRSCGCREREKTAAGKRFGRLIALNVVGTKSNQSIWFCKCDCGKTCSVYSGNLYSGRQRSCGCLYRQSRGMNLLKNAKKEIAKLV